MKFKDWYPYYFDYKSSNDVLIMLFIYFAQLGILVENIVHPFWIWIRIFKEPPGFKRVKALF